MGTSHAITRRSFLSGLPLAAVAASLPVMIAHSRAAMPSPLSGLIDAYHSAKLAVEVATAEVDPLIAAFNAANETDPVMVALPGIRRGKRAVPVTRISPAWLDEFYAPSSYGFHSGKGGGRLTATGIVMVDVTADAARDHAQAVLNYDAGLAAYRERAERLGVHAAEDRLDAAYEKEEAARVALLAHVPVDAADGKMKADYLLSILDADPDHLSPEHVRLLVASIGGGV
ncbi:MAG: hypothetical protein ACYC0C_16940 [Devosia sp.]